MCKTLKLQLMNKLKYSTCLILIFLFGACQKNEDRCECDSNGNIGEQTDSVLQKSTKSIIAGGKIEANAEIRKSINLKVNPGIEYKVDDETVKSTTHKIKDLYPDITTLIRFQLDAHCRYVQDICKQETISNTEFYNLKGKDRQRRDSIIEKLILDKINKPNNDSRTGQKGIDLNPNPMPNSATNYPIELNTDIYFNKNTKTDVAILVTSDNKKADSKISSEVSAYFTSKGLANNPVFFKSPFISKFSDRLKDNDISVFNSLDVQNTVNCVCLINQENFKIEDKAYENNPFKKASASYSITLFYLNGSASPQTFQLNCQGTDSDGNKAQEYLKDDFITAFKNLSINFNQCKK